MAGIAFPPRLYSTRRPAGPASARCCAAAANLLAILRQPSTDAEQGSNPDWAVGHLPRVPCPQSSEDGCGRADGTASGTPWPRAGQPPEASLLLGIWQGERITISLPRFGDNCSMALGVATRGKDYDGAGIEAVPVCGPHCAGKATEGRASVTAPMAAFLSGFGILPGCGTIIACLAVVGTFVAGLREITISESTIDGLFVSVCEDTRDAVFNYCMMQGLGDAACRETAGYDEPCAPPCPPRAVCPTD